MPSLAELGRSVGQLAENIKRHPQETVMGVGAGIMVIGGADIVISGTSFLNEINRIDQKFAQTTSKMDLQDAKRHVSIFEGRMKDKIRLGESVIEVPSLTSVEALRRSYEIVDLETDRAETERVLLEQKNDSEKRGLPAIIVGGILAVAGGVFWQDREKHRQRATQSSQ